MGFHVVNITNNKLVHEFVEEYEELAFLDFITKDSIIYQGESHWNPFKVSDSERYKHLSKRWFRAGIQAQELFKEQAIEQGFILEELNQDKKSFVAYTKNSKNIPIKRGDFLIRNFGNIEVEVKCRGFKEKGQFFDFKCSDVEKHLNMQDFTNTPILIAVYENRNFKPVSERIYFFPLSLFNDNPDIKVNYREGIGDCFKVPIKKTVKGFDLIKTTFETFSGKTGKKYTIEQVRIDYPNAYKPWTKSDDKRLKDLVDSGKSIKEIAEQFGRKNSAIRSRLLKINEDK